MTYFPAKKHRIETFRPSRATVGVADVKDLVGRNARCCPARGNATHRHLQSILSRRVRKKKQLDVETS